MFKNSMEMLTNKPINSDAMSHHSTFFTISNEADKYDKYRLFDDRFVWIFKSVIIEQIYKNFYNF